MFNSWLLFFKVSRFFRFAYFDNTKIRGFLVLCNIKYQVFFSSWQFVLPVLHNNTFTINDLEKLPVMKNLSSHYEEWKYGSMNGRFLRGNRRGNSSLPQRTLSFSQRSQRNLYGLCVYTGFSLNFLGAAKGTRTLGP